MSGLIAHNPTIQQTCQWGMKLILPDMVTIKKKAFYRFRFNFDGSPYSDVSHFQILIFIDFQALASKFVLALEPTVLKVAGSSFVIRPSICILKGCYDEPILKSTHKCDLGDQGVDLRLCWGKAGILTVNEWRPWGLMLIVLPKMKKKYLIIGFTGGHGIKTLDSSERE